jgi:hypothetical protein
MKEAEASDNFPRACSLILPLQCAFKGLVITGFTLLQSASTMTRISPVSAMAHTSLPFTEPTAAAAFPNFPDGDIAVAFTAIRVYRLHSSVLKRNSKYFAEKLHDPGPKLNKQAREDGAAAYRLEFRRNAENENLPGSWDRKVPQPSVNSDPLLC